MPGLRSVCDREESRKTVKEKLTRMAEEKTVWGYSLAFVDRETAEYVYGGVMGCIPPFDTRPVERGLYYDLASLSKVVGTTSRILQLEAAGELSLDTPVCRLLPSFPWEDITVGNLMLHNSGLPAEIPDKASLTRETILERLYGTEPESAPGRRFLYSDVGYILLGLIIREGEGLKEHVSLDESFRRHIFGPLGMDHTSFPSSRKEGACVPTEKTEKRGLICGEIHDSKAWILGESGSAGLFSTLEDLARFVQAYLRQSGDLFSKDVFHKILAENRMGRTYGWSKEYGNRTLYHTGFTGTSILMDLELGEGMVLLTNRIHPDRADRGFLEERKKINKMWLGRSGAAEGGEKQGN